VGVSAATWVPSTCSTWGTGWVDWTRDLARHVDAASVGAGRWDRTQLIEAAHGVLVVASFQAELAEVVGNPAQGRWLIRSSGDLPASVRELWARDYRRLVAAVIEEELPLPRPRRPYEGNLGAIQHRYGRWTARILDLVDRVLAAQAGDSLDDVRGLPSRARRRHEAHFPSAGRRGAGVRALVGHHRQPGDAVDAH
jgi:hypothetical protein